MNKVMANQNNQIWVALAALLSCGALLGLSTNLAKVAANQGLAALPFLTWSLAGATAILSVISMAKKQPLPKDRSALKYYFVSAFVTVAGSNLILFSAVPHVGVSFVALTISLPPLLTYLVALFLGMEKYSHSRAMGVLFALAGTGVLVAAKWSAPDSNQVWILITLVGPVLLAIGNIYRTSHWPKGAKPESLAPGMLMAATMTLLFAGLVMPGTPVGNELNNTDFSLIAVQSIVFAAQFSLLFVLQKAGGPVFLSLMGAVSAIFAIPFAVTLFEEAILPAVYPASALILLGIACMLKQQLAGTVGR